MKVSPTAPAAWQREFLREERLPDSYLDTARVYFDPLAAQLAALAAGRPQTLVIGVNGAQGSGKTTLSAYLCRSLAARHGLRAMAMSLDDCYLRRDERAALAARVHPLCMTRGVPGTHDVPLLEATLDQLCGDDTAAVAVPSFDKSLDDRAPEDAWPRCTPPLDAVLIEGWCLGAMSETEEELATPCNALERDEDAAGRWRHFSNRQLAAHYAPFYERIDYWVMLAAPSFEAVLAWRQEQEDKLRAAVGGRGEGLMTASQLQRFVAHFERHTRNCLRQLPDRVDVLYQLDANRRLVASRGVALAP